MAIVCETILGVAVMVALSMPQSKMRSVVVEICCWIAVVFCGIYAVSPVDLIPEALAGPFGFFDDVGALFLGWQAFRGAKQLRVERNAGVGKV